jgi:hypothetical protein
MHSFTIFLSSVNFLIKLGVIGVLYLKFRDAITA